MFFLRANAKRSGGATSSYELSGDVRVGSMSSAWRDPHTLWIATII